MNFCNIIYCLILLLPQVAPFSTPEQQETSLSKILEKDVLHTKPVNLGLSQCFSINENENEDKTISKL